MLSLSLLLYQRFTLNICLHSWPDHFELALQSSTKDKTYHLARVGLFDKSMFVLIYNDEGHRETPSYVTFTDQGPITGLKAKEQATSNPENTIYDFRYVYSFF